MKYFTSKWWSETCLEEGDDTFERYRAYINSVRSKLPPEVLRLVEGVSLHDARVRSLALDAKAALLVLKLDGFDYSPLSEGKRPTNLQIALRYEGLSAFSVTGKHGTWFKESDLGYLEIEVLGRGKFEHRMLFDSGDEITIRFRNLTVETSPKQKPALKASARRTQTRR